MRFAETQRRFIRGMQISVVLLSIYVPAQAQEPTQPATSPPPLKVVSRQDREQLNQAKDSKARVRTTVELAEAHLTNAERHASHHEYESVLTEVGQYWALIDDAFLFLKPMSRDSNKTRDLYKRIELALRAHGPRLSSMRRGTPLEYAVWIKETEDFARKGRTDALNSFYGHTVVRESKQVPVEQKQGAKRPNDEPMIPEPNNHDR